MSLISHKWANLPAAEKNVYIEKAKLDKWRYLNELNEYLSSGASTVETSTKVKPKKFGNAFTYFLRERKEEMHEEHPELSMSEIMSLVAKEWRELSQSARQKYVEASEEDRERYKREVTEMTRKAKTASKAQSRKKIMKNAKNLEKTKNDLIQYSAALNSNKSMDFVKQEEFLPYQDDFGSMDTFMVYLSEASIQKSINDWVPKIEERDTSVEKEQELVRQQSFESNVLAKLEAVDNLDFFLHEPKTDFLASKPSEFLPQHSVISLNIEPSVMIKDVKATTNTNTIKPSGRSYLNNALSSVLNCDVAPYNFSEMFGNECSLMAEQSFDRIFS
eukprot:CAMPEP_0176433706 /NCGR_PEP_ID=MMETSP0127-20121128/16197_1 /TAXON_ID=938130 /ORGANISM="Platyophrya macrostoma, Strain WH" /LENGTH=331 /DNA_ID=CAMNT_0017816215 /DNA_START=206 /DNA_END=1201 /DNA_ORIENTATION=+